MNHLDGSTLMLLHSYAWYNISFYYAFRYDGKNGISFLSGFAIFYCLSLTSVQSISVLWYYILYLGLGEKKCIFHMPVKLFMVAYPHFRVMNDSPRYFDTPTFFVIIYFWQFLRLEMCIDKLFRKTNISQNMYLYFFYCINNEKRNGNDSKHVLLQRFTKGEILI